MSYKLWNELLFSHFFNPSKRGKTVLLDLDDDDLLLVYRKVNTTDQNPTKQKAAKSFIAIVNTGPMIVSNKNNQVEMKSADGFISKIEDIERVYFKEANKGLYKLLVNKSYSPLFLYAVAFVYAAKRSVGNKFYEGFKKVFGLGDKNINDERIRKSIEFVWEKLEDFFEHNGGELGYFYNKKNSPENRKYIDKVLSQFIIPKTELRRLPQVFWEFDLLSSESEMPNLIDVILNPARRGFLQRTIPQTLLKLNSGTDEDKGLVEEVIRSQLQHFEGYVESTTDLVPDVVLQSAIGKLKLAIEVDELTGNYIFQYRFYSEEPLSESITLGDQKISVGINGWSEKVDRRDEREFYCPYSISDPSIGFKAIFKPDPEKVYVFEEGIRRRLNSNLFIEADNISRVGQQLIIFSHESLSSLENWIKSNKGEEIQDVLNAEGWLVYKFNGFSFSLATYKKLVLPSLRSSKVVGGLKGKGPGVYIKGFTIEIYLEGAVGDEVLCIGDRLCVPLNQKTQTFKVNNLNEEGEYHFRIESLEDKESISLVNNGKIIIEALRANYNSSENIDSNTEDQFSQALEFNKFINLLANMPELIREPPQLLSWKESEIEDCSQSDYSKISVQLIAYLSYLGRMSRQTFDRSLAVFYDVLCLKAESCNSLETLSSNGLLLSFEKFKRYTLNALIESSRLVPSFDNKYSIKEVTPLRPFIVRVVNATNFDIKGENIGARGATCFSGKLFYVGGCYDESQLLQIQKVSKQPQYKKCAFIKLFSEETTTSLNPPSVFIYVIGNTDFIERVKEVLNYSSTYKYFELFPKVQTLENVLKRIKEDPGKFHSFHSIDRCKVFNGDTFQFEPLSTSFLPLISLTKYTISNYQQLVIIRGKELEAEIDLRWGRYLYLSLIGKTDIVTFDSNRNILAVPARMPFPLSIEQTFYFSTGRLPLKRQMLLNENGLTESVYGKLYILYQGILEETARRIINCLNQTITKRNIITNSLTEKKHA